MTKMAATAKFQFWHFFNASGRIAAGALSDKIGRIHTLMIAIGLSVVGAVVLYATEAVTMRSFMRSFGDRNKLWRFYGCISGIYGRSVWCKK